jgi:hypothetical protein
MNIWLCNYMSTDRAMEAQRARLVASFILGGFNGTIFLADEYNEQIPFHSKLQYGFKVYCLNKARQSGADIAIWSDTRIILSQPFVNLVKAIKAGPPVFLHKNAGWNVGQWTHSRCLEEFAVTREKAYEIPTVVSGFIAYDFTDDYANEFFLEHLDYCQRPEIINGPRYKGGNLDINNKQYLGHRHDQSILSLMAHNRSLPLAEGLYADPTNAAGVPPKDILHKTKETLFTWLP